MTKRSRQLRLAAALAAGGLLLSACGGGDEPEEPDSSVTPTTTASEGGTTEDEVEVTPEGTQLAFGESATVEHDQKGETRTLGLSVESAKQGAIADFAGFDMDDPYRKKANYYYVRVQVENAGDARISGGEVPLWGISGEDTLLPVVKFTSSFKKCPTEGLPKRFKPGDTFKTCLVYLSPNKGTLEGLSYRPTEEYVPIEWHGDVEMLKQKGKKKQKG
jgi:hypothetical protein